MNRTVKMNRDEGVAPTKDPRYHRDIKVIKMAQAHFGLADDEYRDVLQVLTKKRSSTELSAAERTAVIAHFKDKGFVLKTSSSKAKRPTPQPTRASQLAKVRAMLIDLGNLPDSYAEAIIRKQLGGKDSALVVRLELCTKDELQACIGALARTAKYAKPVGLNKQSAHARNRDEGVAPTSAALASTFHPYL